MIAAFLAQFLGKRLAAWVAPALLPVALCAALGALYLAWDRAIEQRDAARADVARLTAAIAQIIEAEGLADDAREDLQEVRDRLGDLRDDIPEEDLDATIPDSLSDFIDGVLDTPGITGPAHSD